MGRAVTYPEFVADSFILGGRYRFDKSTFSTSEPKTKITCLLHGDFWQSKANHIRRRSKCPECSKVLVGRKSSLGAVQIKERLQKSLGPKYKVLKAPANIKSKATIKCLEHGCSFQSQVTGILHKKDCKGGCPKCNGIIPLSDLVTDSFLMFKGRFKILSVAKDQAPMIVGKCIKHGEFTTYKSNLLKSKWGCPECNTEQAGLRRSVKSGITVSQAVIDLFCYTKFRGKIKKAYKEHRDIKLLILCKKHGEQLISWKTSIKKGPGKALITSIDMWGCPICSKTQANLTAFRTRITKGADKFYALAAKNNPHMQVVGDYKGIQKDIAVRCDKGHVTTIPARRLIGSGGFKTNCDTCHGKYQVSQPELEIRAGLEAMGIDYIANDRTILNGKELDIYIPKHSLAIEYNGVIWHSEKYRDNEERYHVNNKRLLCESKGIRLITINSTDNFKVAMQLIMSAIGCNHEKVFARKCKILKTDTKDIEVKKVLEETHIQGKVPGCITYCLTFNEKIISLMCFSLVNSERGKKKDTSRWELRRYAGHGSVIGGASRLLKTFLRDHPECSEVISYSDNRVFNGGMYPALGFHLVHEIKPDYGYTKNGQTLDHKAKFTRARLASRKDIDFVEGETEVENCRRNGWFRVWDCGKKKWLLEVQ